MDTNIQKYIALLTTAEVGSITRAAESLGYSQSAVSRMIQDLEREWDISLLERGRHGVRTTSDGLRLLPHIRRMCADYRDLQTQVDELRGFQTGLIRIGTFSSVATHWLPNILLEFQKNCPGIEFELLLGDYSEIEGWILSGRVDCGFLLLPTHPELETIFLGEDKLLAILPEGHPLASQPRFPLQAVREYPFLLLKKGQHSEISDLLESNHMELEPSLVTLDDYAIMSLVEKGLGISILPQLILRRCPYRIVMRELDVPASRKICLSFRRRGSMSLAMEQFVHYLPYR